jgi:hypothetical protein
MSVSKIDESTISLDLRSMNTTIVVSITYLHYTGKIGSDGAKSIRDALMINQSIINMHLYSMNTPTIFF